MRSVFTMMLLLTTLGMLFVSQAQSNTPPRADFRFTPQNPDTNTLVTFDASSSRDPDGSIVKYEWDFNGDGKFDETKPVPTITRLFDRGGEWRINLRVTDNRGATGSISKIVKVTEAPVTVRRSLALPPGGIVTPGQTVRIIILLRINQTINGLGLDEDPPKGWMVKEVQNGGAILKKAELQWLWTQRFSQGQLVAVIYDLIVPTSVSASTFILKGLLTSFSPRLVASVVGESEIRVSR
ncbi:MAG: PKD domain-containing protein [Candidatus Bipolaricaulota bacterium]|nr:PKD domain-containing protein [Candidatus Bipolaricaulota bacterium]MDW8031141.1 PKD domain-containing protein [Candidatus Bipolaricaulota bacterium]